MPGEAIRQKFFIIRENPVGLAALELESSTADCCVRLPVLAEEIFTNELYNDFTSPIFFWGLGFSTATMVLQKKVAGVWTNIQNLNNDNLGTEYEFGFFLNAFDQLAIGYKLDWRAVLIEPGLGEGNYRVKSTGTTTFSPEDVEKFSFEYCLKKYTPERADKTVRFTWNLNGRLGDPDNDKLRRDFGTIDWQNQLRLPGCRFGYDTSPFERTFVKYQNGEMVWTGDEQHEEYIFKSGRYDNVLHRFIKFDILQADSIFLTDYNINNPTRHTNRYVKVISNYEPNWASNSMLASVEIRFQQAFQNHSHKRS